MINNETLLLKNALIYEEGHPRRTQHIIKVHSLAKLIGELENIERKTREILCAAAILHDLAIKTCKEKFNDACQENQRKEAPELVRSMLIEASYSEDYFERIIYLVKMHHIYNSIDGIDYQILIEADILVNIFEDEHIKEQLPELRKYFKTQTGIKLLNAFETKIG